MNPIGALISASAIAVAPPQASLGQPAGLGPIGSVARLIRNRRGPSARLRRTGLASFVALMLVAPSQGSAQALQSFDDLALRVNLDDQLRVEDQSGVKATGRLTRLTPDDIAIQTDAGEKRFASDTVRAVAVRGHALRKGALIGAGVYAVLGMVAVCSHEPEREGSGNCALAIVPLGAVGAGRRIALPSRARGARSVVRPACSRTWRFESTSMINSGSTTGRASGLPVA